MSRWSSFCACSVWISADRAHRDLQAQRQDADNNKVTQLPRIHPVMAALAAGCPLTLLIDLTDSRGPDSKRIMAREHADMSWLRGLGLSADRPTVTVKAHKAS
jgi:hypothetical protein